MGAFTNMFRGFIFTCVYITTTIVIPYTTFTFIKNLPVSGLGIDLGLTQQRYDQIIFWVFAFGLIISGCAFFRYSSPSQSIRKGFLGLIQVILNCFYIWSYKFSGATEIQFTVVDYGGLFIDLTNFIMLSMGIYFLTIIIKVYDVVDFAVNRNKIREKRKQKTFEIGEDGKKKKVKLKGKKKETKLEKKTETENKEEKPEMKGNEMEIEKGDVNKEEK